MIGRISKAKKFMKEHEKVSKISEIISTHFDVPADDDKVLEAADEIYRSLYGERVHVDP